MELEEYKLMYELEEIHWWYRGLRNLLFSSVNKYFQDQRRISVLDAGCGTGYNLKYLDKYGSSFGIDISETAIGYCQERGLKKIAKASISTLPFREESFDLVVSTDVLYHRAVKDDTESINEIYRVLKKGGILIINLPAHNYLRRTHDDRVHTRHRYTINELLHKIEGSDFKPIKMSYRNSFLYPAVLISSLINNGKSKNISSDLKKVTCPINSILYGLLKIENSLIEKIKLPFGTSIFCIAQKL